jgi:ABC-2 type transport system ATP-binding protein
MKAHYTPHHNVEGAASLLPADAEREGDGWRFTCRQTASRRCSSS